jgi:hypothetical protein
MPPTGSMRHLTTVQGSFHGRVVAARLGAEGILVELRGVSDGPYPLQGAVDVYVSEDELELSRELLLADAVDAAVDDDMVEAAVVAGAAGLLVASEASGGEQPLGVDPADARHPRWLGAAVALMVVVALLVVGVVAVTG